MKARAVAGAVPGLLDIVPSNHAAKVWTHRRVFVADPVLVAIDGELGQPAPHHGPLARQDVARFGDVAAGEPIEVLRGYVEVLAGERPYRPHRLARRVVQLRPGVGPAD